jgi:hypothetical protein
MERTTRTVRIELTHDEAYEILMRCLQSPEQDTPIFHAAIQRLARAIEAQHEPGAKAA